MDITLGVTVKTNMCDKAVIVADHRDIMPWGFPLTLKALDGNAMYKKGEEFQEKVENILEIIEEDNSKHAIAQSLHDMLYEALRGINQEGGIQAYTYDHEKKEFNVTFSVVEIEEDNYIGFDGY